jgi:hypothetical protein
MANFMEEGKIVEAEKFYYEHGWDQYGMAESYLAQIHSSVRALGTWKESQKMWFFLDGQRRVRGPVLAQQIVTALEVGQLMHSSHLWAEGLDSWKRASEISYFRPHTYLGPLPPPPPRVG